MQVVLKRAEKFYIESLKLLQKSKVPFMIAGSFAVMEYTGIQRKTKDLDIFCKAGDYLHIVSFFQQHGYKTEVEDERYIAKVVKGDIFFDVIFGSANAITPVTGAWFENAYDAKLFGLSVKIIPPEELIWSKIFVQDRYKYDGADIAHVILKKGREMNWERVLNYCEQYWEVLLIHILNFRFIYPTEREVIPRKILDELILRLNEQINAPTPQMRVCRGRLYSRDDYAIDVQKWGFADLIGGIT